MTESIDHRPGCQLITIEAYGLCTCDFDARMSALTHPEAQGNKDLGERAASGLEEKEPLLATRPDGSKTLTQAGVDVVDKACRASSEFLYEIPVGELEITAEMAGAAHTYHYSSKRHLETPIDHWKGVIRAALLQARSGGKDHG